MGKTFWKDIWRSITRSKKRFLSIVVITALGVTVLTGITAACQDMYRSADRFYDEQQLFDIRILSTLGLTQDDVEALEKVEGLESVQGSYSETVHTEVKGAAKEAEVTVLHGGGLNRPYLQQGALPAASGEMAVTQNYLDDTGKSIGDTVSIIEDLGDDEDEDDGEGETPEEETPPADTDEAAQLAISSENDDSAAETDEEDDALDTDIDWDTEVDIEEEAETPTFKVTTFTITGIVLDPLNISNQTLTFRSTATTDYTFFIPAEDADYEVYTSIFLTLAGLRVLNTYSEAYENEVAAVVEVIESEIMRQREQARYDAVLAEALEKITDAETTMNEKFAEADAEFATAWADIEDAKRELLDGEAELSQEEKDALQKLADARAQLEDGKAQLQAGEAELANGQAELDKNAKELEKGKKELAKQRKTAEDGFKEAERTFTQKQAELDAALAQLLPGIQQLQGTFGAAWPGAQWDALVAAAAAKTGELLAADPTAQPDPAAVAAATTDQQNALGAAVAAWGDPSVDASALISQAVQAGLGLGIQNAGQQALDTQRAAYDKQKADALKKLEDAEAEMKSGEAKLEKGRQDLEDARTQLAGGWATLAAGEEELNTQEAEALRKLADAWRELAEGKQELADGEAELLENEQEYGEKKEEAQQKLADAYAELEDIDMAEWYVQDRTALSSYSSLKSDMSSIEAIGIVFPIIFIIVAVLVSLTTMTRMVEEERGLVGTYKALGFSNGAIYARYIFYAFLACLLGGLLGDLLGFIALPLLLINILQVLYTLPHIALSFNVLYGVGGVLLFVVVIVASAAITCRRSVSRMPARLMRPKSPRAGSRIFLERLRPLWRRLRFLNKVTARNLFRYKRRLFMTVLGILGCTSLVLAGFAIKDSVTDLLPKQYEHIYRYDLMVVTDAEDLDDWLADTEGAGTLARTQPFYTGSYKLLGQGSGSESVQLMVLPDDAKLEDYIRLQDRSGQPVPLTGEGLFVTQNAAELLKLEPGDDATLQSLQLDRYTAPVAQVVQNYLGNNVYMTQSLYQSLFGEAAPNAVLAFLSPEVGDQPAYAESLLEDDRVLSSISIEAQKIDFSSNFTLINSVVYLLIVLAAGLAFVVLFTLANTNISERERELATIKVLGFYDKEVHSYVNKESIILTGLGVLIGLPVGRFVSGLLTAALKMPGLYFAVHVQPLSYVIAAVLSMCFALIVNFMTNRTLDHIDMVEALKSVE